MLQTYLPEQLSDAELVYVILHERLLGGANPDEEDMVALEEVALLMSENEAMTFEEALAEVGVESEGGAEGGEGNEAPAEGGGADQTGDGAESESATS